MTKYEVNIDLANDTKKGLAQIIDSENTKVLNKLGAFASLYDFSFPEYTHPVLVLKTEEPGSKQLLAMQYDRIENVCYDMINHLINDCIVMGATPLTIQDAIICGKLDKQIITRIVSSISDACKRQECVLTGGETSEQPGVLGSDVYILTSSIVGIVDRSKIIDGANIEVGDVVLSLESSGIHTNGYTLVRKIMAEHPNMMTETIDGKTFIDAVLEPHRCYYLAVKDLFPTGFITGMAHITGGGIQENLNRILPNTVNAKIHLSSYSIPKIFSVLKNYGEITDEEMLRTFNLGVGLAIVVKKDAVDMVMQSVTQKGVKCYQIGEIVPGTGLVEVKDHLAWD